MSPQWWREGPGYHLRRMREERCLTLAQVENQSRRIAEREENEEYKFTAGRLCQIETGKSLPSIYKFASLSEIYRTPYGQLLRIYGIKTGLDATGTARTRSRPRRSKVLARDRAYSPAGAAGRSS